MKKIYLTLSLIIVVLFFSSCDDDDQSRQKYSLDETNSTIEWKGYSPVLFHVGSFAVTGQQVEVVDGKLHSGTFTIPISSIKNFDLPDDMKPVLLEHLKSADFFNMVVHPNSTFKITKVAQGNIPDSKDDFNVTGDFTMLGQTHPITFPAMIKLAGNKLTLNATFDIDRTKWGMNYAADPALGEHHILAKVDIKLDIVATRK